MTEQKQLNLLTDFMYKNKYYTKSELYDFMITHKVSYETVQELSKEITKVSKQEIVFNEQDTNAFIRYAIKHSKTKLPFTELFDLLPDSLSHTYLCRSTGFLPKELVLKTISKGLETCPEQKLWVSLYYMKDVTQDELNALNQKAKKLKKELAFRIFSKDELLFVSVSNLDLSLFTKNEVFFEYILQQSDLLYLFKQITTNNSVKIKGTDLAYMNLDFENNYILNYLRDYGFTGDMKKYLENTFNLVLTYHPELFFTLIFKSHEKYVYFMGSLELSKELAKRVPYDKRLYFEKLIEKSFQVKSYTVYLYSLVNFLQQTYSKKELKIITHYATQVTRKEHFIRKRLAELFKEFMSDWDTYKPETLEKDLSN